MSESEGNPREALGQAWRLLMRRRWAVLGASFVVPLVVIVVVLRLRDEYTSESILVAVQQQVSPKYVDPVSSITAGEMVRTMTREMLSRSQLISIIDSFGLYPNERATLNADQLAERMRRDIAVTPLEDLPGRWDRDVFYAAFKLTYTSESPRLAQEVTSRLTALLIEENFKAQSNQAAATERFLTEQLQTAKQRLEQQEQLLSEFKLQNAGTLPEQTGINLDALKELRFALQNNLNNRIKCEQQRAYLQRILEVELAREGSDRAQLLKQFTSKHPEVAKKEAEIGRLQELMAEIKSGKKRLSSSAEEQVSADPRITELKARVESSVSETEQLDDEEQRLRSEINQSQQRLKLTPVREQQLAKLLRDYDLYKMDYTDLLNKQLRSQLTARLEGDQAGEHFRLVDPATLPATPSGPKRTKLSLMALAGGIALGLLLAFCLEALDTSFHNKKDVEHCFGAPLVIGVPLFRTSAEVLWLKARLAFEWLVACLLTLLVAASEVFVYVRSGWS